MLAHGQPAAQSHVRPARKWGFRFFIVLMGISLRKQGRYSGIISSSQGRDILLRDLASAVLETNPQQDQRGPPFKRTAPPCLEWKQDFVQTAPHHVWRASTIKQCRIVSGFGVRIPACMSCHCLCCLWAGHLPEPQSLQVKWK